MARPKKPTYEYVERLNLYRKRIKDADGKYVAIYGATPDELTSKVQAAQEQIQGTVIARENPSLSDYADLWIQLNGSTVKVATRRDYQYVIDSYIKPFIGHRKIRDITPDDIKSALIPLSNKSESISRKTVMLYKRIFDSAVDSGIIMKSPCDKIKSAGLPPAEKYALTKEQVATLVDAVRGTIAETFVMIGLYAGLRREEILGLKWDCVFLDETAPHIAVRRAARWDHNQPIVENELKSKAANRDIPIPPQLVECLKAEKAASKSEFVVCNSSGMPKSETQFRNMWHAVTCRMIKERTYTKYLPGGQKKVVSIKPKKGEKARCRNYQYTIDFDVTPHILRHTYISHMLLSGADVKTVQYLAGHEHAKITLDIYAHLTYNRPEDLMDKVKTAFCG